MTLDSLNLPLIITKNFSTKAKDIQGSEIIMSPTTKATLPHPVQPSIVYMEASMPSQLQSMSISKSTTDSPLSSKLRQFLPNPFTFDRRPILLPSPIVACTDEEEQEEEYSNKMTDFEYDELRIPFTQHLDTSSASSATSSTCSSGNKSKTGSKQYSCSLCQKKFMRPSSLKIHIYSHTGEKPFNCSFPGCRRRFSVQSNMRRHLRVHSN